MLPKHYQGMKLYFPDLTYDECKVLFEAGFVTPGDIKGAKKDELASLVSKEIAEKIYPSKKKKVEE